MNTLLFHNNLTYIIFPQASSVAGSAAQVGVLHKASTPSYVLSDLHKSLNQWAQAHYTKNSTEPLLWVLWNIQA